MGPSDWLRMYSPAQEERKNKGDAQGSQEATPHAQDGDLQGRV